MSQIDFKNRTFCFTGRLDNFTRDQAYELVRQRGGFVENRISKHTRYLIVGDKPGSKLTKAKQIGVFIRTEMEFSAAVLISTPSFVPRKNIVSASIPKDLNRSYTTESAERVFVFDE